MDKGPINTSYWDFRKATEQPPSRALAEAELGSDKGGRHLPRSITSPEAGNGRKVSSLHEDRLTSKL